MPFVKPLPHWEAPGIEPPLSLRQNGWKAGVKPPDEYFNHLQNKAYEALKELQEYAVHKDDINFSGLVTDEEFATHLADESTHVYYADDTGTANAKVLTIPEITSYKKGMAIAFTNLVTSTDAVTINVNGLGEIPVIKTNGSAASLKADIPYTVRHNGTSFILQGEGGEYGTASAGDVVAPKTIGTENGLVKGTIVEQPAWQAPKSLAVAPGNLYVRHPLGAYRTPSINGDAEIVIVDDDFVASNILANKNIFGLQGNIPNYGRAVLGNAYQQAKSIRGDGLGNIVVEPYRGYYEEGLNGSGYGSIIIADPDYVGSNIKAGVNIFGVIGSLDAAALGAKRMAKGTATTTAGGNFTFSVRGLAFRPSTILVTLINNSPSTYYGATFWSDKSNTSSTYSMGGKINNADGSVFLLNTLNLYADGFDISTAVAGANVGWVAYE